MSSAAHRRRLGRLGERIAIDFLQRRGLDLIARNLTVGRGELDLVMSDRGRRVAVEVKAGIAAPDSHPRAHFTPEKAGQVARLARRCGIRRVDLVTVVVDASGATVEWHRRVA